MLQSERFSSGQGTLSSMPLSLSAMFHTTVLDWLTTACEGAGTCMLLMYITASIATSYSDKPQAAHLYDLDGFTTQSLSDYCMILVQISLCRNTRVLIDVALYFFQWASKWCCHATNGSPIIGTPGPLVFANFASICVQNLLKYWQIHIR